MLIPEVSLVEITEIKYLSGLGSQVLLLLVVILWVTIVSSLLNCMI